MSKYIIVCGGVISGTGKGVSAASMGLLMKLRGHTVTFIKFDPYFNINAGILAPREHGECFLCDDGTETDLDLGHYSRIAGIDPTAKNICTSGVLYKELIQEQEDGKWLGQTIQIIPHVTDKIQERLEALGKEAEIVIAEIGGTVGDMESGQFYEALRQFKQKHGDDCLIVFVAPILWVPTIKEFKTKPFQNSYRDLQRHGIQADMLFCRVDRKLPEKIIKKISDLTNVSRDDVFDAPDVDTIYQVPIEFYNRHVDDLIADRFRLKRNYCKIQKYRDLVEKYMRLKEDGGLEVNIGIFGKYENCEEAYISLKEALVHASLDNNVRFNIKWIAAEDLESYKDMRGLNKYFEELDGVIIPGGFDQRGVEGKIKAIRFVREKKIPFLGICLGLQCAVIEFARNICGLKDANSTEFDKLTSNPVVDFVEGQEGLKKKSGTMRLGAYDCALKKDTLARKIYNKKTISERHRHRYEVNNDYINIIESNGMIVSGTNPSSGLVEMIEIKEHPYFIATQAHPEFKSSLVSAAPLFSGLINAAIEYKNNGADE